MPPPSSGKRPTPRRSTATLVRPCRWSIAGPTTTACRAPSMTSYRKTSPLERSPAATAVRRRRSGILANVSIFHELTAKPWVTTQGAVENLYDRATARRLALRAFLAVVTVLFMLLVVAYGRRMAYEDWRPSPQLDLLWANTFALILSSVALQWAQFSVRRGRMDGMRVALLAGGAFTVVFLVGQILAWRQLASMVYFDVTNPAIAFFYLITGLHGLHLLGGLVAWGRTFAERGAILTRRRSGTAWSCAPFTGTTFSGFGWSYLVCCFQGITWIFC